MPTRIKSVGIPIYRRKQILIDTLNQLLRFECRTSEILLIGQAEQHESERTERFGEPTRITEITLGPA